jgi:hypothetical protein
MIKPTPRKPEVFAYSAVDATGSKPAKNLFKNALVTYHATGLLPSELAEKLKQTEESDAESLALYRRARDRADELAAQRDQLLSSLESALTVLVDSVGDFDYNLAMSAITNAKGKTE